jgi:UDP-glucuronate decarboxylase
MFRRIAPAERSHQILTRLGIDRPFVLSVCSLVPRKNLDGLIRAFALLRQPGDRGYQLVLVGRSGWKAEELHALVSAQGINASVLFTGYLSDADLVQLYNHARVFAYPSMYEGFGLPPLEAMHCGLPVVTSDRSATAEIGRGAAVLVNPESVDDIAAGLNAALTDEPLRQRLISAGVDRAGQYSWAAMADGIVAFIAEIVAARAARGGWRVRHKPRRRKREVVRQGQILVTGGGGFLGSHLCDRLLRDGKSVLCVDNFSTGGRDNITHLLNYPNFEVLRHDVTFPLYVEVDEIYNLACPASPIHYQFDPVQTTKTCVHGAINMLGLAKRVKAKILQASTSEVYGDPSMHPQREDYWGNVNPVGPRSCYDEGKRCAETLFFDYYRQHKLRIKVARIFNTYGPRMHPNDGRVVSNLIVQALTGRPITVFGDGSQTRSFCYVDDLIEAMVLFMAADDAFVGPVNLGNPAETSVLELSRQIIALTGSRSALRYEPLPMDDPRQRCPDIDLARLKLGWTPVVPLMEGLARTIAYFEALLSGRDAAPPTAG